MRLKEPTVNRLPLTILETLPFGEFGPLLAVVFAIRRSDPEAFVLDTARERSADLGRTQIAPPLPSSRHPIQRYSLADDDWQTTMAKQLGLESSLRPRVRPEKLNK